MSKLVTKDLCYSTNGKNLIENIDLEFALNYLHAIVGPNGSGKSTYLKTLAGVWKASNGKVLWNDASILDKDRRYISRTISLVPQNPHPQFDFIVEDVVAMGRYSHGKPYWNSDDKPLIEQSLMAVDAFHLRSRKVTCLSHGERQRVYIARALATESPVLLLDEPMTSLDIRHQMEIWQLLQQLVDKGKIVVITTHDLAIAEHYCQRVAVFNQGRCIGSGIFKEFITPSLLKEVFGVSSINNYPTKHYALM